MKDDKRYLNFPVTMLKQLYMDKKDFCNNVFDVGIYLYSKTLKGSERKCYKDSADFLSITHSNMIHGLENAKQILNQIPRNMPTTSIEKMMLFDFYNNDKEDFDLICLGAFLAIKSVIGKKTYVKTNKAMIHARMFGYATTKDLPTELIPIEEKYKLRWHMDKVIRKLELVWNLKTLWNHSRGFYLSFDLSLAELAIIVEDEKYSSKVRKLREEKRKAIRAAKNARG